MRALDGWGIFDVIVGSFAGALIGLQFVIMTLIANMPIGKDGLKRRPQGAFVPKMLEVEAFERLVIKLDGLMGRLDDTGFHHP